MNYNSQQIIETILQKNYDKQLYIDFTKVS